MPLNAGASEVGFTQPQPHATCLTICLPLFILRAMELLDLCYDVLIRILEEVNPEDLAACARTCWGLNHFVKQNRRLFKTHYLKNFVSTLDFGRLICILSAL